MPSFKEIYDKNKDDFDKVVQAVTIEDGKKSEEYRKEYNNDRTRRTASVGNRQDKQVDNGAGGTKLVPVAKLVWSFPKKIVRTAVAFLFGGEMTVTGSESDDSYKIFKDIWVKKLKMHSTLKKFARTVMIETKAALLFYPVVTDEVKFFGITFSSKIKLKVKLLDVKSGEFFPHYDDYGDMDAFVWKYKTKVEGKDVDAVKIYTIDKTITAIKAGKWDIKADSNLFKKIPVVYAEQDQPEWEDVVTLMDQYENRNSRLSDTNDYFSEPMVLLRGEPKGMPEKGQVGKLLQFDPVEDENGKKTYGGAEYLTWDQTPEAIKLELQILKDGIHSMTSTPDISFDNVKGLGNVSGIAMKLLFLDAMLKATDNMEIFGEALLRCVSVVKAGIGNIAASKYSKALDNNDIEVSFGSVLPEDLKDVVDLLLAATGDKPIMSQETAISQNPIVPDAKEEIGRVQAEAEKDNQQNNIVGTSLNV